MLLVWESVQGGGNDIDACRGGYLNNPGERRIIPSSENRLLKYLIDSNELAMGRT